MEAVILTLWILAVVATVFGLAGVIEVFMGRRK